MKYSEVLYTYQPLETGDFMCRYYINDREYIVYSPEQGKISCLELCNFKDITPYELAILIQRVISDQIEVEEFSFAHICNRDNLITYLFDVSADNPEGVSKIRHISNNIGYFLYELKASHKVRNIYQYNKSNNEYQLLFENEVCYTSIFEDTLNQSINICWNPVTFSLLEEDNKFSYLLASSNPILCVGIIKMIQDQSAKINMCINRNSMEALLFLAHYTEYKDAQKGLSISYDNKRVTVLMKNWQPITLVRFVSKIQKKCREAFMDVYKEVQEREFMFYQLESVAGRNFVTFPKNDLVIEIFLRHIILELNLDDISILDISSPITK